MKYLFTQVEIFHIIANLQIIANTRYTEMKFQPGMKISIIINPFFISKKPRNMKNNFYFFNNYIFVHMFQSTSSKYFFFNFRFSSRKSQSLQKLAEKVTYFTIQFCSITSLISRTSTHLTLKKNIFPANIFTAKNLSHFTNLPADIWLV